MKNEQSKQQFYGGLGSDYFWFYGHYALADMLLKRFCKENGSRILNIGCGPNEYTPASGYEQHIGADFSFEACRLARPQNPHTRFVCCDAQALPFKDGAITTIIALEILEHCEDDRLAGREFNRILEQNGTVLVSVPAYTFLWGTHDRWNRHFRRYTAGSMRTFSRDTGMRINYLTYYKLLFVIPLYLFRKIKQFFGATSASHDFLPLPRPLNALLRGYLMLEAQIARIIPLPAGVSLFTVLTRADRDRSAPRRGYANSF